MYNLNRILRENIKKLKPYSSARDDFEGEAQVWIDANESPFNTGVNRYPDPHQRELKARLAEVKDVAPTRIFVGNGSDEIIDLLYRLTCTPGQDNAIVMPPTYGMYAVAAAVNDVKVIEVCLCEDFSVDVDAVLASANEQTKLIFICSPNNPTGSVVPLTVIERIAQQFDGLVVVDEAYIDFTASASAVTLIERFPNVVVLQTLSKAWGMAGLRVGVGIAADEIVAVMDRVKAPYNVSTLSQQVALNSLNDMEVYRMKVDVIVEQREWLRAELVQIPMVENVYPSEANFLLVRMKNTNEVFQFLKECGIVARDRSKDKWCEGCLRFSVGTPDENALLVEALKQYVQL